MSNGCSISADFLSISPNICGVYHPRRFQLSHRSSSSLIGGSYVDRSESSKPVFSNLCRASQSLSPTYETRESRIRLDEYLQAGKQCRHRVEMRVICPEFDAHRHC